MEGPKGFSKYECFRVRDGQVTAVTNDEIHAKNRFEAFTKLEAASRRVVHTTSLPQPKELPGTLRGPMEKCTMRPDGATILPKRKLETEDTPSVPKKTAKPNTGRSSEDSNIPTFKNVSERIFSNGIVFITNLCDNLLRNCVKPETLDKKLLEDIIKRPVDSKAEIAEELRRISDLASDISRFVKGFTSKESVKPGNYDYDGMNRIFNWINNSKDVYTTDLFEYIKRGCDKKGSIGGLAYYLDVFAQQCYNLSLAYGSLSGLEQFE